MEQITKKYMIDIFSNPENTIYFAGSAAQKTLEEVENIIDGSPERIELIIQRNTPQRIETKTTTRIKWSTGSYLYLNKIECFIKQIDNKCVIVVRAEDGYFSMIYIIV